MAALVLLIAMVLIVAWDDSPTQVEQAAGTATLSLPPTAAPSTTPTRYPTATPYLTATHSPALATAIANDECLNSFDSFAYHLMFAVFTDTIRPYMDTPPPLSSLWQPESAAAPAGWTETPFLGDINIWRMVGSKQELWIRGWYEEGEAWLIYQPESKAWEMVPSRIDGTDLYTGKLFITSDGTLWSQIEWLKSFWAETPDLETIPILSRFNENTRRFEIPENFPRLPLIGKNIDYNWHVLPRVLLDENDIFWIFMQHDGLYRYDPVAQTIEKQAELPDFLIAHALVAPDGSLYFTRPTWRRDSIQDYFTFTHGMLLQFIPETGGLVTVDTPDEDWPIFSGILFDRAGRLWLGSIGYREPDGSWHLIHPDPEAYFDVVGHPRLQIPTLIMEGSDGRLWYTRDADGAGSATGWYDPASGEGCVISYYPASIIEDANQQLWMVTDGKLYRHALNPR